MRSRGLRPEIQALRCLAIVLVILNHLYPSIFPGGFIGVDVFFAISGFLITKQLIKGFTNRINVLTLKDFYCRRFLRLVPASMTTIIFVSIMICFYIPTARIGDYGWQIIASAFYFQNWVLGFQSVDYFATDQSVSPLQHFWSLGVEEQFYIIWPPILLIAIFVLPKILRFGMKRWVFIMMCFVTVISLTYSIFYSSISPQDAYFITTTRIWELGFGGILAASFPNPIDNISNRLRSVFSSLSFGLIIVCVFLFNSSSLPWPSGFALIPCLLACVIIMCGMPKSRISPSVIYKLPPVQLVGDISYSLYLWHWPLIVFAPLVLSQFSSELIRPLSVLVAFILAVLSRYFIELKFYDPEKYISYDKHDFFGWFKQVIVILVFSAVVVGGGILNISNANKQFAVAWHGYDDLMKKIEDQEAVCFGAQTVATNDQEACQTSADLENHYVPEVTKLPSDAKIGLGACNYYTHGERSYQCPNLNSIKSNDVKLNIALVGDSKIGQFSYVLGKIGLKHGWHITDYSASHCQLVVSDIIAKRFQDGCELAISHELSSIDKGKYDYVLVSSNTFDTYLSPHFDTYAKKVHDRFEQIEKSGAKIIVIRDNYVMMTKDKKQIDYMGCLKSRIDPSLCEFSANYILPDVNELAAKATNAKVLDFSDIYCPNRNTSKMCPIAQGGIFMYRDYYHLTILYTLSMQNLLEKRLLAAMG